MIDAQLAAFAVAAALLTVTPGQDTLLVIRNVLRGGARQGVATTLGVCSGLFLHAVLSAIGMSVVLMQSAFAFQVLKAAGAVYLVWLGGRTLVHAARGRYDRDHEVARSARGVVSSWDCVLEGLLSNALNPKTALFYLAFLPQFIRPTDPVLLRSLLLAGVHFGEAMVWLVFVSVAVGRVRLLLATTAHRWLDGVCGTVFVALGIRLAFER
jgi:threonine/homoserine/homoserine lactone efflux protein